MAKQFLPVSILPLSATKDNSSRDNLPHKNSSRGYTPQRSLTILEKRNKLAIIVHIASYIDGLYEILQHGFDKGMGKHKNYLI